MARDDLHRLVLDGNYDEAIDHITAALAPGSPIGQAGSTPRAQLLAAALDLVQVCRQQHAEQRRHADLAQQAARQARRAKERLLGLLKAIDSRTRSDQDDSNVPLDASCHDARPEQRGVLPNRAPADATAPTTMPGSQAQQRSFAALGAGTANPLAPPARTVRLQARCLGAFQASIDGVPIDCADESRELLGFLVAHHGRPMAVEALMESLWPTLPPERARDLLGTATERLVQAFGAAGAPGVDLNLRRGDLCLDRAFDVQVDAEQFIGSCEAAARFDEDGRIDRAVAEYQSARALYCGPFLASEMQADWILTRQSALKSRHVDAMDRLSTHLLRRAAFDECEQVCLELLAEAPCNEEVHQRLMRCYSRVGQTERAIRQYHVCVGALARGRDLPPSLVTVGLLNRIRRRDAV